MRVPRSFAKPTPFSAERAREILAAADVFYGIPYTALTDGEDEYVHEVWKTLSDKSTWMSALHHIAKGRVR